MPLLVLEERRPVVEREGPGAHLGRVEHRRRTAAGREPPPGAARGAGGPAVHARPPRPGARRRAAAADGPRRPEEHLEMAAATSGALRVAQAGEQRGHVAGVESRPPRGRAERSRRPQRAEVEEAVRPGLHAEADLADVAERRGARGRGRAGGAAAGDGRPGPGPAPRAPRPRAASSGTVASAGRPRLRSLGHPDGERGLHRGGEAAGRAGAERQQEAAPGGAPRRSGAAEREVSSARGSTSPATGAWRSARRSEVGREVGLPGEAAPRALPAPSSGRQRLVPQEGRVHEHEVGARASRPRARPHAGRRRRRRGGRAGRWRPGPRAAPPRSRGARAARPRRRASRSAAASSAPAAAGRVEHHEPVEGPAQCRRGVRREERRDARPRRGGPPPGRRCAPARAPPASGPPVPA